MSKQGHARHKLPELVRRWNLEGIMAMNSNDYTISSGNVFADAELPDAEELLMKADLLYDIATEITRRGLIRRQTASLLGIPPSDVSRLLRPRLSYFSLGSLQQMSAKLGSDRAISR